MRRLSSLIALVILLTGRALAQEVEIHNGAEFKIAKKKRVDGFVGKLYLISRMYERGGNLKLFASTLDATTGKLGTHFELLSYNTKEQGDLDRYDFIMSRDSSKMVLLLEYRTKKDEPVKTGFKVFNDDLTTLWQADIILPTPDKNTTITDYLLDNNGNIHMVARIALDKSDRDEKGTNVRYKYSLFSYFHETQTVKEYDLFLQNNYLTGLTLLQNKNNELIGSAFIQMTKQRLALKGF
ncbi:MAG: hypothetical protein IPG07_13085 [Crocinitomicaceae bacterium]|nr:hypothetical protein [Crocinitomicaceae bacterium]